jgi:hypothetical protein
VRNRRNVRHQIKTRLQGATIIFLTDITLLTDCVELRTTFFPYCPLVDPRKLSVMQEDVPYIIEAVVQALLYGLYVATLVHCLRWLLYNDKDWSYRKDINWPMLAVTVVIFLLSTASLGLLLKLVLGGPISVNTSNVSARKVLAVEGSIFIYVNSLPLSLH